MEGVSQAIGLLRNTSKRLGDELRQERQKKGRLEKKLSAKESKALKWLQVLWLLSGGHPHLMRCAWAIHQQRVTDIMAWGTADPEEIWLHVGRQLEDNSLTQAGLDFLLEPTSKEDLEIWYRAWEFCAEWKLARSAISLNVTRHMVAPPAFLHEEFRKYFTTGQVGVPESVLARCDEVLLNRCEDNAKSMWLTRWRRKWGFQHKHLPSFGQIGCAEISDKVILVEYRHL